MTGTAAKRTGNPLGGKRKKREKKKKGRREGAPENICRFNSGNTLMMCGEGVEKNGKVWLKGGGRKKTVRKGKKDK